MDAERCQHCQIELTPDNRAGDRCTVCDKFFKAAMEYAFNQFTINRFDELQSIVGRSGEHGMQWDKFSNAFQYKFEWFQEIRKNADKNKHIEDCMEQGHLVHECSECNCWWCETCGFDEHTLSPDYDPDEIMNHAGCL